MKTVCIQGLGFVGTAMAVVTADAADENNLPLYNVIGVEQDNHNGKNKVKLINNNQLPLISSDEQLEAAFHNAISRGNLSATTDNSVYMKADIIIIDINLDLNMKGNITTVAWDTFKKSLQTIGNIMPEHALIIVETTVPPGTCELVICPLLKECFEKRGLDPENLKLAHSYERVMPGRNYLNSIKNFWRVYSAISDRAADECKAFFESIINVQDYPLTRLACPRESETAKVLENSYRAVNIAFIEEWSQFAQHTGIDLFSVLKAIRVRPTHANIMSPGFGVGGYCLTKDPHFAEIACRELFELPELRFPFSTSAVKTNNQMPSSSVKLLRQMLGGEFQGKSVLLLGVSYRPDVGDTRYSPSEFFVREVCRLGGHVVFHDPYVVSWPEMHSEVLPHLPDSGAVDAIVLAVAHSEYRNIDFRAWLGANRPCILDANNVLNDEQRKELDALHVPFKSIGRG